MKLNFIITLCLLSGTAFAQFKNIELAREKDGGDTPGDPSVIVDHMDPNHVVVGMGLTTVSFTVDGGATWTASQLNPSVGSSGNPTLVFDAKGRLYLFHRGGAVDKKSSSLDRIVCHKSDDGGKSWKEESVYGNEPTKANDKQWVSVNPRKQMLYATWTQSDQSITKDENCHSSIMFSIASNAGNKWDKPVRINELPGDCSDDDSSVAGAIPVIDFEGKIFVTWSNQGVIFFDRSYDDGKTWLRGDLPIAKQTGGWVANIPGFGRTHNFPLLLINNASDKYHGYLYLVFADQRNGENDTDIWLHRSTRRGDSWTSPSRVNADGPGKQQFQPSAVIDQTTGFIYIVYYDRRNYEDLQTDVYLAFSTDGGNNFKETKISETPFTPSETKYFEHTAISAHSGVIVPVWTRVDGGKTSVWTAIISDGELVKLK